MDLVKNDSDREDLFSILWAGDEMQKEFGELSEEELNKIKAANPKDEKPFNKRGLKKFARNKKFQRTSPKLISQSAASLTSFILCLTSRTAVRVNMPNIFRTSR